MFRKTRPSWYTTDVAEKVNEDWNLQDRRLIHALRVKENRPVKEVVRILGWMGKKANNTTVHNLTREGRAIFLDQCYHCRTALTQEELAAREKGNIMILCHKCKEESQDDKKKRREEFLNHGMCGVCGKRPVLKGHTSCRQHLSAANRRRIAIGMCGTCGEYPIDKERSIHQCSRCL